MGHWIKVRTSGGPWRRAWISDAEEAEQEAANQEIEQVITDAYRRHRQEAVQLSLPFAEGEI